jgi:hypothetical protein
MEEVEKDSEIGYEASDFIPGTNVLAVERKETGQESSNAPSPTPEGPPPADIPGRAIPNEPKIGRRRRVRSSSAKRSGKKASKGVTAIPDARRTSEAPDV